MTIGLAPLTLFFFQRAPLISFVANLVAVPWIGLVIGPLILIAVALLPVAPGLAASLLNVSDYGLDLLWRVLELLAALPFAQWHQAPVGWTLLPATVGMVWLLAPHGWPARWLGLLLLLPMAMVAPVRPAPGGYTITLLDVGQGLAAVIETRNHVLVYDTGPRFSDYFNAGDAAVIPYLRRRGIERIDTLVISHRDNDHSGGAAAVLAAFPVTKLLTSAPRRFDQMRAARCRAGQRWRSDGVTFEILHPSTVDTWPSTNNRSCVLRVVSAGGAVLLPGDIEADAERALVRTHAARLASDVLVVPHHGSATSSSARFIEAVGPELALVSTAYRNQWGFPAQEVLARYHRRSIAVENTATSGALTVTVHPYAGITLSDGYRQSARRFWTARP
ncbi:MAG: DNA internalization-related competence protein ComEC/Rec2 [Gammaproteobacteria bacterium]